MTKEQPSEIKKIGGSKFVKIPPKIQDAENYPFSPTKRKVNIRIEKGKLIIENA